MELWSRFRTKTGPRPRDVLTDAPPLSPLHAYPSLPCTNQSIPPTRTSSNAPGQMAGDPVSGLGSGLSRSPDSSSVCVLRSCSSLRPGPSLSPGLRSGPSPGPSLSPGLRSGPSPGPSLSPGLRSYLQSLDSSSRAWLLSSGKVPPPAQVPPPVVAVGEGLIWYNPIPEEEEGPLNREVGPVGREAVQGSRGMGLERRGAGPEKDKTEAKVTPEHSGGVSERVMDKLRSPALKLRRKLSLKSRRERHGNSSQDTPPTSQSISPQDSSSPSRKRPIRRQQSSRRGRHGDEKELLKQPVTSQQGEESSPYSPTHSVTGVLTMHLQKLNLPTHRAGVSRYVSVVMQVDDIIRARTAAMTMTGPAHRLDHAFRLQLERAQTLKVLVLSRVNPDPGLKTCSRTRLCAVGGASLPALFRGSQTQDLVLDLDPRGTLLLRLALQAGEEAGGGAYASVGGAQVFGAELRVLVQRESSEKPVPLIIQKTVSEINRRGLKVQGVYRLCGSSSLKKKLRDSFESNSFSVNLRECPDLHAITGVLKDYLRELPSPLITSSLYEAVKKVMTSDPRVTPDPVQLLQCLPLVYRATLSFLMSHLALVSSLSSFNKMSAQNLSVCFGPVLFVQSDQWERSMAVSGQSGRSVDFKQHIEALHFLLRHWPVPPPQVTQVEEGGATEGGASPDQRCRGRDLRHRQAGDWSRYQQRAPAPVDKEPVLDFENPVLDFENPVLDFENPVLDIENPVLDFENPVLDFENPVLDFENPVLDFENPVLDFENPVLDIESSVLDLEAPFNCRLSLKDFDLLIQDFHRQLNRV